MLGTRFGAGTNATFDLKVNGYDGLDPRGAKVHGDIGDGEKWIENALNVYGNETGNNAQGGELAINRWYHLSWAVDGTHKETRMYINGDRKKAMAFPPNARSKPLLVRFRLDFFRALLVHRPCA